MQFGIFTVGDVTTDPTTGTTVSEHERIRHTVELARAAEQVGLDVFATGEHHNPPFAAPANPPVLLAHLAAVTERLVLSTATTLITTNDPVRLAEDYAYLQHLAGGRVDLMLGRGNTGPVYPWFGKDIRDGISLAVENYALLRRLWTEENVTWEGGTAPRCSRSPPPPARSTASRRSSGTARSAAPRSPSRPPTTATASSTTTSSGR